MCDDLREPPLISVIAHFNDQTVRSKFFDDISYQLYIVCNLFRIIISFFSLEKLNAQVILIDTLRFYHLSQRVIIHSDDINFFLEILEFDEISLTLNLKFVLDTFEFKSSLFNFNHSLVVKSVPRICKNPRNENTISYFLSVLKN
jgi:hypothetical protein